MCVYVWAATVCIIQMSCCYFAKAVKSFIKYWTPYIWMRLETEYTYGVYLIKETFDKAASTVEWQPILSGFTLHESHPEGPTSSWNFKQSGARTAVPLLLENWQDGSFFRVTYIFSEGDADWAGLVCGEYQTVAQNLFSSTDHHKEAWQTLATGKVLCWESKGESIEPECGSLGNGCNCKVGT